MARPDMLKFSVAPPRHAPQSQAFYPAQLHELQHPSSQEPCSRDVSFQGHSTLMDHYREQQGACSVVSIDQLLVPQQWFAELLESDDDIWSRYGLGQRLCVLKIVSYAVTPAWSRVPSMYTKLQPTSTRHLQHGHHQYRDTAQHDQYASSSNQSKYAGSQSQHDGSTIIIPCGPGTIRGDSNQPVVISPPSQKFVPESDGDSGDTSSDAGWRTPRRKCRAAGSAASLYTATAP
ncbi:hypothetical protein EDB19DRAFT_1942789 [Suillus lakei]|nr:hypothetical protein EDB19DRAFT_1942789 [Suillus lakei]